MATNLYDGTSAYKMEQYYDYTQKASQKQDERRQESRKRRSINIKRFSIVLSIIFTVAIAFLYANVVLIETSSRVNELNKELEDMKVRNTQVSFDISSGIDYGVVEQKAISEFGMQHPESYQVVYVDVQRSDYTELPGSKEKAKGFVEGLISNVQSFLAYIS